MTVLEERKGSIVAFLAALQARAGAIEHRELEREQAAAPSPSDTEPEPEPATTPEVPVRASAPAAVPTRTRNPDSPPAYPILDVPHPPCACMAGTSDNRPHAAGGPPGPSRCTALRLRDGERCTWTCAPGQRFCRIWHCVGHSTVVMSHRTKEERLELLRKAAARGGGDNARRIRDVKNYVEKLEEMITIIEDHQRLFSCRCEYARILLALYYPCRLIHSCLRSPPLLSSAPAHVSIAPGTHEALLRDLGQRRTIAGLLLGKLSGRTDAGVAENQGQEETWAMEFLAEVKNKDAIERRKAVEDLLTVSDVLRPRARAYPCVKF